MARGRGGKAKRGGGHSFSRDLVLNEDGVAVSSGGGRSARRARAADDERVFNGSDPEEGQSGEESEEEEEEEVEEEEEETPAAPSSDGPVDTAAARAAKKAQKAQAKAKATKAAEDEEGDNDEDLVNPNHATPKNFKAADLAASAAPSRRERICACRRSTY
ncbi:hypothetical protein DL93DRAFT_2078168 [Clavulina sp. PMI_390]|nr:hypothetical protein DL93DRAFT_2078168 [Clavulina sp. PMI_390]